MADNFGKETEEPLKILKGFIDERYKLKVLGNS
jgi:hypothetical protein